MYPQYVNVTYPNIPESDQRRSQMPYIYNYPTFHIPSPMRVNPVRHFPSSYQPSWYQIPDTNNYFPPYPYHPSPLPYFHDACCPWFTKMHHHHHHHHHHPSYSMEQLPMHGGFTEPQPMNSSDQSQFPFPLIWIPYKPEEAGKKDNAEDKTTGHEEVSPFESSKESVDTNVAQATTMVGKNGLNHCKLIPVKQLDATISKDPENELAKNSHVGGNKRSKLPPVCLRVEPFPKRKNASGKSRSLSPPKRKSSATMEDMKSAKENEQSKLALVADPKTNQAEIVDSVCSDNEAVENVKRNELTEVEAAVIIQAAHRGYEVRKWEPIKKLKAIGKVREELNEVKSRIKAMEFSSSSSSSDKEAILLGEMIMSLLLKLDTIQGLDPVTRDMRKSTANELVNLQEQVDSVVNNKGEDANSSQMQIETTGNEETTTVITSSEEKDCEGEVEALMGEADNGGGIDEDTCVEEGEKSSGEENVRLMMEKLVEKGKEQLEVITELSERIKMLEKKLATKKAAAAAKKGKGWGRTKTRPRR